MFGVETRFALPPCQVESLSRKQLNALQPRGFPSIAPLQLQR